MHEPRHEKIAEYFHRSYTAVDGLWFMKVEERYGFDEALDIDSEVWKVMPKIQARKLKELLDPAGGLAGLLECLSIKKELENFGFRTERDESGGWFSIVIEDCPWHNLMVKSQRVHLSGKVGEKICEIEYAVWASEFGDDITFELKSRICNGDGSCVLHFNRGLP